MNFKPDWARGVVALMIVDLFVAFVAVDTISRIAVTGLRNTLFVNRILSALIKNVSVLMLVCCASAEATLHSPRGAELFAVTPRIARQVKPSALFLPVPKRLFWAYEPTSPEHAPLAEVSFVVESSTNQVDWIARARLASPPFVFTPSQAQEFFRVAAYRITP